MILRVSYPGPDGPTHGDIPLPERPMALDPGTLRTLMTVFLGSEIASTWTEVALVERALYVFEELLAPEGVEREDGGCALIATVEQRGGSFPATTDEGLFVRLQSWADDPSTPGAHHELLALIGRRVRVTIEAFDNPQEGVDHVR